METPKKRSKFKIGCLGIIIIVIIIVIICAFAGGKTQTPTVVNGATKTTTQQSPTSFKLGQTIKMGNYDITVSDLTNTQNISDSYGTPMSSTKNNFAIFKVVVKNNSASPISSLALGYQKIFELTSNNKNYFINTSATISKFTTENLNNSFDTAFCGGNTLSPNTPYDGYLVFETPGAIKTGSLTINLNNENAVIKF